MVWGEAEVAYLLQDGGQTSNVEFINLMFASSFFDSEIVLLLGVCVQQVWTSIGKRLSVAALNINILFADIVTGQFIFDQYACVLL